MLVPSNPDEVEVVHGERSAGGRLDSAAHPARQSHHKTHSRRKADLVIKFDDDARR